MEEDSQICVFAVRTQTHCISWRCYSVAMCACTCTLTCVPLTLFWNRSFSSLHLTLNMTRFGLADSMPLAQTTQSTIMYIFDRTEHVWKLTFKNVICVMQKWRLWSASTGFQSVRALSLQYTRICEACYLDLLCVFDPGWGQRALLRKPTCCSCAFWLCIRLHFCHSTPVLTSFESLTRDQNTT